MAVDEQDLKILEMLQSNARIPNAEIARQIGMAPSAVLERVRRLEERGVILGYETRISPKAVGLGLTAFAFVRSTMHDAREQAQRLAAMPEILEVHEVAGEDCFLIKVRVADPESLLGLMREGIGAIPAITGTRTTIVLQTQKESSALPLPAPKGSR